MRMYKGYFDIRESLFSLVRPAESKAHFYSLYGGYGEILKIEEVTTEGDNEPNGSTETSQREIQQKSSKGSH